MKARNYLKIIIGAVSLVTIVWAIFLMSKRAESRIVKAQPIMPKFAPIGGGKVDLLPGDKISDEQRQRIIEEVEKNTRRLEREGKIPPASSEMVPFSNVVRAAPGNNDFGVDAISNHVDHNFAFPNQVRDYNCGTRTFDVFDGYNHQGTDIFTFPFWWKKMDDNAVEVIAGASGIMVAKIDGNFDRNCGGITGGGNWNVIVIRHADNTHAWYGHLKSGSLTTKPVNSSIAAGERLGVIGSSGPSTNPHLHLEIRINNQTTVQDPFQGPCNLMNNVGWWANQEPYRVSRINKLMTHSAPPVFPTCPNTEITNEKNSFRSGETVVVGAYYRDELISQQSQMSLIRPDGSVFQTWLHTAPQTASVSYWLWQLALPANAPSGTWKFRAVYNSQTYDHNFTVTGTSQFDFDGDGKADTAVFRPNGGNWYLNRSNAGFSAVQWGLPSDLIAPADFDGDGKTDIAVFRDGNWYILQSSNGAFFALQFGSAGDLPRPADFDGDGKADINVFRPSNGAWYRLNSSDNQFNGVQFGINGDAPLVGDFDGDGKADVSVFRPADGNWYRLNSSDGSFFAVNFGTGGDIPVPADFDGDGKTDVSVFRPSNGAWYRLNSSNNSFFGVSFGLGDDLPTAADYDGDGKADISVFRPSNGAWYRLNSSNNSFFAEQFGVNGDKPIPSAFGQ